MDLLIILVFISIFALGIFLLYLHRRNSDSKRFNKLTMYRPTTVANYFIENFGDKGELTPMKLLKLTYIAYGFYLALTNGKKRLVDEKPVAWDLGPVFPSLYSDIKRSYDKWNITKPISTNISEIISDQDKVFLGKIWALYGKYNGEYLSALTHEEGTPWSDVYKKHQNMILQDEAIISHYKLKLKTA